MLHPRLAALVLGIGARVHSDRFPTLRYQSARLWPPHRTGSGPGGDLGRPSALRSRAAGDVGGVAALAHRALSVQLKWRRYGDAARAYKHGRARSSHRRVRPILRAGDDRRSARSGRCHATRRGADRRSALSMIALGLAAITAIFPNPGWRGTRRSSWGCRSSSRARHRRALSAHAMGRSGRSCAGAGQWGIAWRETWRAPRSATIECVRSQRLAAQGAEILIVPLPIAASSSPPPTGWPTPKSRSASASLSGRSVTARHSAHAFSGRTAFAIACRQGLSTLVLSS